MIVIIMGRLYNIWSFVKWVFTLKAPRDLYILLIIIEMTGICLGLGVGYALWAS